MVTEQVQGSAPQPTGNQPAPAPAPLSASPNSPQTTPAPAPNAPVRPEGLADAFWDAEKGLKTDDLVKRFNDLDAAAKAADERKATLPKVAGDYKVELPAEMKLPEGWQVDEKNPAWGEFAKFAHANGLTQDQFKQAAGMYVQLQVGEAARKLEAANAEFAKLGDNGRARVTAVHQFIDANAGTPERAAQVKAALGNSDIVTFIEDLQSALVKGGVTSFNHAGREKPGRADGKPDNWDAMSAVDRRTYQLVEQQRAAGGR